MQLTLHMLHLRFQHHVDKNFPTLRFSKQTKLLLSVVKIYFTLLIRMRFHFGLQLTQYRTYPNFLEHLLKFIVQVRCRQQQKLMKYLLSRQHLTDSGCCSKFDLKVDSQTILRHLICQNVDALATTFQFPLSLCFFLTPGTKYCTQLHVTFCIWHLCRSGLTIKYSGQNLIFLTN